MYFQLPILRFVNFYCVFLIVFFQSKRQQFSKAGCLQNLFCFSEVEEKNKFICSFYLNYLRK